MILSFASVDETSVYEAQFMIAMEQCFICYSFVCAIQGDFVYETLSVCFHMTLFTLLNKGVQILKSVV